MTRRRPQPLATIEKVLQCVRQEYSGCGTRMWNDYDNYRRVRKLSRRCAIAIEGPTLSKC